LSYNKARKTITPVQWYHNEAITKIQPRPKQINEYRGFGATNGKGDLTKKRLIDKFSEQWEAYLILFP